MDRPIDSTVSALSGCWPAARAASDALDDGPWAATVALRDVVMGWMRRGPAAAGVFAVLGLLLGLLSRHYLPTRSIFELM
jgi:hypothetical protein